MAVVLVEHDVGLVMRTCRTVAVMDLGHVLAVGPPEAIQHEPSVVAAYLGTPAAPR
jgi:ABC-type branched-subunit amino acid transport system ATPase component